MVIPLPDLKNFRLSNDLNDPLNLTIMNLRIQQLCHGDGIIGNIINYTDTWIAELGLNLSS